MNIFFTDKDPLKAAANLDDRRCIKMILESTQMLCTALNSYGAFEKYLYTPVKFTKNKETKKIELKINKKTKYAYYSGIKRVYAPTHINHPSNLWARQNLLNWTWLYTHALGLCAEYQKRYGKRHKAWSILMEISKYNKLLPVKPQTPFANCAAHAGKGISYKHLEDTVQAYRLYLSDRWSMDYRHPTWTNTNAPYWITYSKVAKKFLVAPEYELVWSENEQV